MKNKSLTALVSAFARAYHAEHNRQPVFDDSLARAMLSDEEYFSIGQHMSQGAGFFLPDFSGTQDEALRAVVDYQLSPTPLGRAAFTEQALYVAVMQGAGQYLILAAGYDSFACRQPRWARQLQIYEVDHPATAADKQRRIAAMLPVKPDNVHYIPADLAEPAWLQLLQAAPGFNREVISFISLLGISYYLPKAVFRQLLSDLAALLPAGSSFVFDYPDEHTFTPSAGERAQKQVVLAAQSGEPMQASYAYDELEQLLEACGLLIYRHLTPSEINSEFFKAYNDSHPGHHISAFDNVNYCLAVKR
ncbi:class I SAM-dependent methyltransferase [Paenibacillus camerounensis]|uniref:class I SAM-dependent methyltransferase n=1 Tax=Paenibacillus camerounensis TaxID=1243663 RepID=UPI0005AA4F6D|nr:SAM-dependent methyltransferase [Paenibacillus camerounensis]